MNEIESKKMLDSMTLNEKMVFTTMLIMDIEGRITADLKKVSISLEELEQMRLRFWECIQMKEDPK